VARKPKDSAQDLAIAIVHGPDAFRREEALRDLRERLASKHGDVDRVNFDGATATAADVLDECRSMGLIAAHKLVVVDNAEQLVKEANRPLFERYAQGPAEGATLVLRANSWRAGKLDAMVEAVGVIIECEPPNELQAQAWVEKAAARHGATIEPAAAKNLVARVGPSLMHLNNELAKLAVAAEGGRITPALVTQFVGLSREEEAWNVQRSLLSGRPEMALAHLRHVLDVSRQPAVLVTYAMIDLARKLHGVACAARDKRNPAELTKPLRLWGESQRTIIDAGSRLSPRDTLRLYAACVEGDARLKQGLGDAERTLEMRTLDMTRLVGAK